MIAAHTLQQLFDKAQAQHYPTHSLYVVASPVGNLADLSLRSMVVLSLADSVVAEDTRVTGQLLSLLGLKKPMIAADQYREAGVIDHIMALLAQGQRVALLSDAGTPAISDPGALLVAAAHDAGWRVLPIAGASSLTLAASASGLIQGAFGFAGFAPNKGASRSQFYQALAAQTAPQLWFEAPHRLADAAAQLATLCPARVITVARELSKQFEQIQSMRCQDFSAWLAQDAHRAKGEFVCVLGAITHSVEDTKSKPASEAEAQALQLAQSLMAHLPASKASSIAAQFFAVDKSRIYKALHADSNGGVML